MKLANIREIQEALESLVEVDRRIAVNSIDNARWLAYTFIEADRASWSSFREVGLYQLTAEAIKAANKYGFIGDADLWDSDESLWRKLELIDHSEVRRWVKLITPGTRFIWSEENPMLKVSTKVRSIDPPVVNGDLITPLSVLDPGFARYRREYLASKQGQWSMEVVSTPIMD